MLRLTFFFILFNLMVGSPAYALSVTANDTSLGCGVNNITFTFDCAFTGTVLINGSTTGIEFTGLSGPPYLETVTNGEIAFDIEISGSAPTNFNISFIVLSSNLGCASNNDSASESFTHDCNLPGNDNCATATVLSVSINSCNYESFTTSNGTVAATNPSCGGAGYHDLWYSFNANNSTVTFEYGSVPGTVGYYGLYSSCGGTEIDCDIIIPATGITSFDFTGLTVGSDYFLQFMYLPGNSGMDQTLCLHSTTESSCPSNIIVSDGGSNPPNQSYDAADMIITSGACNVSGADILFTAGQEVSLNIGFDSGSDFEAVITVCVP